MKENIKIKQDFKDYKILRVRNIEEICKVLHDFDKVYETPLSERGLDLNVYAEKLYKNAVIFAAIEDDEAIGFVAFYANDRNMRVGYLTQIAVKYKVQNKKIGKALLDLCIETSKGNGMSAIKLEVHNDNSKAINFYKKNGFEFCGEASSDSKYMIRKI